MLQGEVLELHLALEGALLLGAARRATRLGLEVLLLGLEVLEEAGRSNGQLTELMINYLTTHKLPEEARKSDAFQGLMRGHMQIGEKDLAWALQLARQSGVALPVASLVSQSMARLYGVEDDWRR